MELRRALLLFAIVLGVAAIVAALAGSSSREPQRTEVLPEAGAKPARPALAPTRIRIDGRRAPVTRTLDTGRATTVVVSVDEPGQVELQGLGLTASAEPHDPAIFDTLPTRRGRYTVLFTPAGGVRARALAELVSRPDN